VSQPGSDGPAAPSPNGERTSDLLELADALMERARTLASQSDQLIAALDDTARRLIESGRGVKAQPLPAPVRLLTRHAATEALKPPDVEPSELELYAAGNGKPAANGRRDPSISDGARLLISQMALAGRDHDEIAQSLREDLGIADAEELLERAGF
jgi:hypothetical protein